MEFKLPDGFSCRIISSEQSDGSMSRDYIEENLPRFLQKNFISSPVAYCQQVHGSQIKIIDSPGFYEDCDGLVTGEEIALIVKSADCVPLLFFDNRSKTVGAIHVGRRSLVQKIISKSLDQILKKLSHSPAELNFFIGPHIRGDNYEIKKDVITSLPQEFQQFVETNSDGSFFDLTAAVLSELELLGAKRENIVDSSMDTFTDSRFYSYRKGESGLFVTIITNI